VVRRTESSRIKNLRDQKSEVVVVRPRASTAKGAMELSVPNVLIKLKSRVGNGADASAESTVMTDLVTHLVVTETALVTMAGVVSARVMKGEIPFSIELLEDEDRSDYLATARGIVLGTVWAVVLWTAVFGLCALSGWQSRA
jgi:hypothetical protein